MSEFIHVDALLQVVVAGALVGAGLPALFALGVRLLAPAQGAALAVEGAPSGTDASPAATRPTGLRLTAAALCFGTVLAACAVGIWFLASGGH